MKDASYFPCMNGPNVYLISPVVFSVMVAVGK